MITAFVMIKVEAKSIPETAQRISEIEGVSEVYSVSGGDWDLIAIVRVRHHEQLAEIIPQRLSKVDGIISTTTNIAFRAFSQHDLEAAFSLD